MSGHQSARRYTRYSPSSSLHRKQKSLSICPLPAKPVDGIAEKAGRAVEEVTSLCEKLVDKGLVFSQTSPEGKKVYMLLPMMPGVFEYPIMKRRLLKIDYERLIPLWRKYWDEALGQELHGSKTNMVRVVPVRQAIDPTSRVFTYDELAPYIEKAECISVSDCPCRVMQQKCDSPLETCFSFDGAAKFLVGRDMGRLISKEEAFDILKECEEAGLVHLAGNTADRILALCNCCSCCCNGLGAVTKFKGVVSRPVSSFYAIVNTEACTVCGLCEEKCPVKAIRVDGDAVVDTSLCLGCGLCFSVCPADAVHLLRRADAPQPPKGPKELGLTLAEEKGRLQDFMANLK